MKAAVEKATRKQFPRGLPPFGADALRFTFAALATQGRDVRFDLGRIEGYRNFCNKLWNAARYVWLVTHEASLDGPAEFGLPERWVRSRLRATVQATREHLETYRLDLATQALYDFTWHELCDWYLELSKPVLQDGDASAAARARGTCRTLLEVLETVLRLLHPLTPFITEEIWQRIAPLAGRTGKTLMREPYPAPAQFAQDAEAEAELGWIMSFVLGIRQIRGEMDIAPSRAVPLLLQDASADDLERLERHRSYLQRLANLASLAPLADGARVPASATALLGTMKMLVPLAGLIDADAEISRLEKRLARTQSDRTKLVDKLANAGFASRAPAELVEEERGRPPSWSAPARSSKSSSSACVRSPPHPLPENEATMSSPHPAVALARLAAKPLIERALDQLSQVILGKDVEIRLALACLIARGHLLIEDIPGVGKTTLAHALARTLGLSYQRIQFTSDLLPADIIGVSVFERTTGEFRFHRGPIFAQLVLADEVNRATPKTQSALLEAMEEQQVTVDGVTHVLPGPFFVVATQNPTYQIGTFPLPESQLDRFLMRIALGYPAASLERQLIAGADRRALLRWASEPTLNARSFDRAQAMVPEVHVADALLDYIQALRRVHARDTGSRRTSPRAATPRRAAQALALIEGHRGVLPEDLQAVVPAVVGHRLRPRDPSGPQTPEEIGALVLGAVAIP
jgi:MoxR-like ATPase